jgi:hypothetical protein
MVLRIYTVIMFLVCLLAGIAIGWLTTRGDLEAAQTAGEGLKTENGQYFSSFEEMSRLAKIANEQVVQGNEEIILSNLQIDLANASITELKQKLGEAEKFGAYWWKRAHPEEFKSVDELKAWLAQDDTESTLYIFGAGCMSDYDCDDYAVALVYNALADGYSVSLQVEGNHMLNSAVIGNEIYFIEPQNDEVWLWGHRD